MAPRPKGNDEDIYGDADAQLAKLSDTSKFRPDKGFQGAESRTAGAGPRNAPLQFEKASERDPYERSSRRKDKDEDGKDRTSRSRSRSRSPPRRVNKRSRHDYHDNE